MFSMGIQEGQPSDALSQTLDKLYRLGPLELNAVVDEIAKSYHAETASPDKGQTLFHLVRSQDKEFILCPMSKDAQALDNERHLSFFKDLINQFKRAYPNKQDCILLMPLLLCRGYLKMPIDYFPKSQHSVLGIYYVKTGKFQVNDAQNGWIRKLLYWDKAKELVQLGENDFDYNQKEDYKFHGQQQDSYSCGYYVAAYIRWILKHGTSAGCETIKLDVRSEYPNKRAYLLANHALRNYSVYKPPIEYPLAFPGDSRVKIFLEGEGAISDLGMHIVKDYCAVPRKVLQEDNLLEDWLPIADSSLEDDEESVGMCDSFTTSSPLLSSSLFRSASYENLSKEDGSLSESVCRLAQSK
jgi:hypothetical protein